MTISPSVLQSMIKRNADTITNLHECVAAHKQEAMPLKKFSSLASILEHQDWCYKQVASNSKTIKQLVAIQKELKKELRAANELIHHGKLPNNMHVTDKRLLEL